MTEKEFHKKYDPIHFALMKTGEIQVAVEDYRTNPIAELSRRGWRTAASRNEQQGVGTVRTRRERSVQIRDGLDSRTERESYWTESPEYYKTVHHITLERTVIPDEAEEARALEIYLLLEEQRRLIQDREAFTSITNSIHGTIPWLLWGLAWGGLGLAILFVSMYFNKQVSIFWPLPFAVISVVSFAIIIAMNKRGERRVREYVEQQAAISNNGKPINYFLMELEMKDRINEALASL